MEKDKLVILMALVVVVAGGLFVYTQKDSFFKNDLPLANQEVSPSPTYSPEVPKNISLTETKLEADIPDSEGGKIRIIEITITGSGFSPSEIVVNKGDLIKLSISSPEGNYDFDLPDIGSYQILKQGDTKSAGFIASKQGTFSFMCKDYCPPSGVIKGSFIVK